MYTIDVTPQQIASFRIRRSGLVEPFDDAPSVARSLIGVQAQILPAAGLAIWNRTPSSRSAQRMTEERINDLLENERSLVKLWGQRGTLHVYPTADWPLVHGASKGIPTWSARSYAAEASAEDYERAVQRAEALLRSRPTLSRSDLRDDEHDFEDRLLSSWGGIFTELVRRGVACHAGREAGEGRFAHRERWVPDLEWQPPERDAANTEIARRFLAAYGPATVQDLAYWRGTTVANARKSIDRLGDAVAAVRVISSSRSGSSTDTGGAADGATTPSDHANAGPHARQSLLALASDEPDLTADYDPRDFPLRLLNRFDPVLLAHKDKSWIVPAARYADVWRPAGHIEAVILRSGRVAGTWRYDRSATSLKVTLRPFRAPGKRYLRQLERLAEEVADFFQLDLGAVIIE